MTTNTGETFPQDPLASVIEELLKEQLEPEAKSKAASRAEDAVMADMAEALRVDLARTVSQASPFEKALLVSALAPALADALAPKLGEALAPAIMTALSHMAAPEKAGQESTLIGETSKPPAGPGSSQAQQAAPTGETSKPPAGSESSQAGKPAAKSPSSSSEGSGKQK